MRRILTTVLASSLLALAIPAAASAHHGSRERHHHHRRHHHTIVFSPTARRSDSTTVTQTPAAPTEQVATVASFAGGVLELTLADGSTVSGKVTENTEISCGCDGHHFEDGPQGFGHDNGDDQGDQGDDNPGFSHHDDPPFGARSDQGQMGEGSCGVSSLVPGAKVKEAELNVSGTGASWEHIELVPQS